MKWVKVFNTEDAALGALKESQPRLLKIGDKNFCITLFNKKIYVADNKCPHNGDSLSNGSVNYLGEIICPWHNYRYNLMNGKECNERSEELKTYPVKIETDGVFVGLPK